MNNIFSLNSKRMIVLTLVVICSALGYFLHTLHAHPPFHIKHLPVDIKKLYTMQNIVPVLIIGSGPAGLSPAVYTGRANLHTVVIEGKKPGGQLMGTSDVENWPGIQKKTGPDIIEGLREQALSFHAVIDQSTVEKADFSAWPFKVWTDENTEINALSIIIATGANPRKLGVPGEEKYWGKGVTTCAICDAPFYKDRNVVVVGGGDSAAEEALQLASNAKSITILVRGERMRASHAMQERLKVYPHIAIRYNTQIKEILGNGEHVTGVQLGTKGKADEQFPIDGVFLAIGHVPNSQIFADWLTLDENGYIELAPHSQSTSIAGIFAAGDVSDHQYRQAGVAAGDGIKAGLDATKFLVEQGFNDIIAAQIESHFFDPETGHGLELPVIKDEAQFEREVLQANQRVVVDFYTQHCPSCLQMMPLVSSVASKLINKVKFVKIDGAELPQLMERYAVTSVPSFLIFEHGIVVGRTTATMTKREIREFAQRNLK